MRKLNVLTKIFIKKKAFQSTMDERDDDREKYESQEEVSTFVSWLLTIK